MTSQVLVRQIVVTSIEQGGITNEEGRTFQM